MANRFLSVETIEVVKAYIRDNIDKKPADIAEVFGFNTTTAYRYKVQVLAESRYRAPIKAVYLGARDIFVLY